MDYTSQDIASFVNISYKTALYWVERIQGVCIKYFEGREKMGGDGYIIEIDESLLRGKRKHNKGRYLTGDRWKVANDKEFFNQNEGMAHL